MIEPRVYTNSKDDVGEASKDFNLGDAIAYINENGAWEEGTLANIVVWDNLPYRVIENKGESYKIRKLQKPVNPYADLEENGKFKVVEAELREGDIYHFVNHENKQPALSHLVNHKDFAGYLFSDNGWIIKENCWHAGLGHAIAVLFRVSNG